MIPLLGMILLSAVGQLGLKAAFDAGKKLFGNSSAPGTDESFPAQLKRQMDQSATPAPTVDGPLALAQLPPSLQVPSALPAEGCLPVSAALSAYRRFEAAWPGRSMDTGVISRDQNP